MKARVYYNKLDSVPTVGTGVFLWPVDHTSPFVSNNKQAWTSPVVRIIDENSFETENTIYIDVAKRPQDK